MKKNNEDITNEMPTLAVQVDAETRQKIEDLCQKKEWELEEGLRLLLGTGLGFYLHQLALDGLATSDVENYNDLMRMFIKNEASLASTRYKLFEMMQSNQNWQLTMGAIENESKALKGTVQRLREENEALKLQLQELGKTQKGA